MLQCERYRKARAASRERDVAKQRQQLARAARRYAELRERRAVTATEHQALDVAIRQGDELQAAFCEVLADAKAKTEAETKAKADGDEPQDQTPDGVIAAAAREAAAPL
eukprot:TRINITY_DN3633_c0_g1_i1.p3 TRINITY_DN3633_c0_g1~~TRINITY_DN3633_c0_g1_i1.p3  ORF type:complete len:109 (+),score=37.08 TRINITY_DN3633_c0_g1_i1:408-734(+)